MCNDNTVQVKLPSSPPARPKSVAEIVQKENVCNIKIKDDSKVNNAKPKRSASSVSTTKVPATVTNVTKRSDKASRLLGIDEHQVANGIDSGRFSMGSSLSPLNEKKIKDDKGQHLSGDHLLKTDDKEKFKSLGDLHMEKGLPTVLVNQ